MRALIPFLLVSLAMPAFAQTAQAPASHTAASSAKKTPATGHNSAAKKPASKTKTAPKAVARKTPVVAPRRAGPPRRPVHAGATAVVPAKSPKGGMAKGGVMKNAAVEHADKPAAKPPAKPVVPPIPPDEGTVTHLHIPRFVSLKTDDVNMRKGPGARYPVEWTYKRRELPVKVEREFDVWRLVEDMDGVKGWVHQATLTSRRTFVITGTETRTLRSAADSSSLPVAILKPGVVGRIHICDAGAEWCQVQVGGYSGWLQRGDFWGTDWGEAVQP